MNTLTQTTMIQAAASIAALMPAKPARTLMGNREANLMYSVYECAAKAAYRRAAQECFVTAHDAAGVNAGIDYDAVGAEIEANHLSLSDLIDMCTPGYAWGGLVVTL